MANEKLLVDREEVEKLWKMWPGWQEQTNDYTYGVGVGIRFALLSLGLDEEEAKT